MLTLCFVRQHEHFHYLVERACRLLGQEEKSLAKCYERFLGLKPQGVGPNRGGSLDEGMADAFAAKRYRAAVDENGFHELVAQSWRAGMDETGMTTLKRKTALDGLSKVLLGWLAGPNRPAGYKTAKEWGPEMERVLGGQPLGTDFAEFRGFSALFHEITSGEWANPESVRSSPGQVSGDSLLFSRFLKNFSSRGSNLTKLLPLPLETYQPRVATSDHESVNEQLRRIERRIESVVGVVASLSRRVGEVEKRSSPPELSNIQRTVYEELLRMGGRATREDLKAVVRRKLKIKRASLVSNRLQGALTFLRAKGLVAYTRGEVFVLTISPPADSE